MDERIRQVIANTFGIAPEDVTESASQQTVDRWDSMGHVNLVMALELEFRTHFTTRQIPLLVDFSAIRNALKPSRLAA